MTIVIVVEVEAKAENHQVEETTETEIGTTTANEARVEIHQVEETTEIETTLENEARVETHQVEETTEIEMTLEIEAEVGILVNETRAVRILQMVENLLVAQQDHEMVAVKYPKKSRRSLTNLSSLLVEKIGTSF
jgi:hypothetical protein